MKKVSLLFSLLFSISCLIGQVNSQKAAKIIKIPMEKAHWEYPDGQVEFIIHRGIPAMKNVQGRASITAKDIVFENGTIEFDLEILTGNFVGINFRSQSKDEKERVYLRPSRAASMMDGNALQYAPFVKGVNLWDLLGHYQSPALVKKEGWNHVKMVIAGYQMRVYVNDMENPALEIPKLAGNTKNGSISFNGQAIFANVVIQPDKTDGLSPEIGIDPTDNDPKYLRNWEMSEPIDFPFGREVTNEDMPDSNAVWTPIKAERLGLVNITRKHGRTAQNERRLIWLKTTIQSDRQQDRRIDLGFSDEVWVMINGRLLYLDKNYFNSPIEKEPDGRISLRNTSFKLPLQEGENELQIGVGNFFFGWGIMARLDRVDGIRF